MILGIIEKIEEWVRPFKNFVINNHGNPFMWLIFFLVGIAIFSLTFSALHRNND